MTIEPLEQRLRDAEPRDDVVGEPGQGLRRLIQGRLRNRLCDLGSVGPHGLFTDITHDEIMPSGREAIVAVGHDVPARPRAGTAP